jgi:uncharacterized protein (TIRG00374 family)
MMRKLTKTKKFFVIALSVGLVLFLYVTWKSGPGLILQTLRSFTLWHFIAISATLLMQWLFSVISLGLIIKRLNHRIHLHCLFPLQLIKFSISYITPFSNNGGEPLQIYLLKKKYRVPYSKATAAVILEAILKLAVSLFFMAFACIYFLFTTTLILKFTFLLLLSVFVLLIALFFYQTVKKKGFLAFAGERFKLNKLNFYQKRTKIIKNIDKCTIFFFHRYPRDFILTILIAFLTMGTYFARFYLIILFLGYSMSMLEIILVFSITQLMLLVPIPTLLGVHEAGQSAISLITNIPMETGVSFVIILRVINLIMTIPGLILVGHHGLNGLVGKRFRDRLFFALNNKKN